jgi:hypothetical protein
VAITFDAIVQEVLNLLSAVEGSDPDTAESNYTGAPTTSAVIGPDFTPAMVKDAVAGAIGEIVEAIASTPLHPERARFASQTTALASGSVIPRVDNVNNPIIGVIGAVRDQSDNTPLLPVDVDRIRSVNKFTSTIYSGFSPYWFAIDCQRIYHTRALVVIDVCVYSRPTSLTGNISLDDWHEAALVQGAVAKLALKESLYGDLFQGAKAAWDAHLAAIRAYGNPALYSLAAAAPSPT